MALDANGSEADLLVREHVAGGQRRLSLWAWTAPGRCFRAILELKGGLLSWPKRIIINPV